MKSLYDRRLWLLFVLSWVNPRVRVFVRRDVVPRLRDRTAIVRIK